MTTTADLGILIRDMIVDIDMECFDLTDDPEVIGSDHVDHVDVSDPHNPRVYLSSGAVFRLTIVREG
jgi:hypothetical protein